MASIEQIDLDLLRAGFTHLAIDVFAAAGVLTVFPRTPSHLREADLTAKSSAQDREAIYSSLGQQVRGNKPYETEPSPTESL